MIVLSVALVLALETAIPDCLDVWPCHKHLVLLRLRGTARIGLQYACRLLYLCRSCWEAIDKAAWSTDCVNSGQLLRHLHGVMHEKYMYPGSWESRLYQAARPTACHTRELFEIGAR